MRLRLLLSCFCAVLSQHFSLASKLRPPVLPLLVRSPYFSTWIQNARDKPWSGWPMFWNGDPVGFSLMASVSGSESVYPLLGRPQDSLSPYSSSGVNISYPILRGIQYDASTTNFTYSIRSGFKSADITLSFLSPITPTSTLRQSIPASYITFYVKGELDVNLYMDVNGQWVTKDPTAVLEWKYQAIGKGLKSWAAQRQTQLVFSEFSTQQNPHTPTDHAEWGTLYFVAPNDATHQSGSSASLRQQFATKGYLINSDDSNFRTYDDDEPAFAFSKEVKAGEDKPLTFTLGFIQDPVVQYAAPDGMTNMPPLWRSWFESPEDILSWHYSDFDDACSLAARYSNKLTDDAYKSGTDDYADIVALSARQVMGACVFAGPADNPILWMKEISSDGNTQTVDVIYPAYPFFLYSNPRWLAYLLHPLLEYQSSGQYPNKYSMHDLGTHFPNATGHPDGNDEEMPVEECGNILILGLALANAIRSPSNRSAQWLQDVASNEQVDASFPLTMSTQNGIHNIDAPWVLNGRESEAAEQWVEKYYKMWKQWTEYLIESALEPTNQLSTDDFAGKLPLQTNLALKGIIGINAMSELSDFIGKHNDRIYYKVASVSDLPLFETILITHFQNTSDAYIEKWQKYALTDDGGSKHVKLAYNISNSWTTAYNLYSDAQLCFHMGSSASSSTNSTFVPDQVYLAQSAWYSQKLNKYGVPLDNRHAYAKSDWEFFAMAVATEGTRSKVLESVARWINESNVNRPLTDLYLTNGGGGFPGPNFFARPVVGGHFAFLALESACGGQAMSRLQSLLQKTTEEERDPAILESRDEVQKRMMPFIA
ncbi:hypothetical protein KEM54_006127 [Ascosphaera aggregata]|nr:hypothetical protein KEM54_006127 [Ascosphaera aggregata]